MSCNSCKCSSSSRDCGCDFNTKQFGVANLDRIILKGSDITTLNWSEISVPEILSVPTLKPDIEHLDQIYVTANISCVKLIETPYAYKVYERIATPLEISTATAAYTAASALNLGSLNTAITNLLAAATDGPLKTAVSDANAAVQLAYTSYTTTLASLNAVLTAPIVTPATLVAAIQTVITAITVLRTRLTALRVAIVALGASDAGLATLVDVATGAIDVLITAINLIIAQLNAVITLINYTSYYYFGIIPNSENTYLTGRKLVIEGSLEQKIVYTGLVDGQSVHSAHFCIPFSAFIIPYAKFEGLTSVENVSVIDPDTGKVIQINGFPYNPNDPIVVELCQEFCVDAFVEDIFAYPMDPRTIFKNVTLFLQAKVSKPCS